MVAQRKERRWKNLESVQDHLVPKNFTIGGNNLHILLRPICQNVQTHPLKSIPTHFI
jgi:hypothetical protein